MKKKNRNKKKKILNVSKTIDNLKENDYILNYLISCGIPILLLDKNDNDEVEVNLLDTEDKH